MMGDHHREHIYWSCRERQSVDLDDPAQRNWVLSQTLVHGTMSDIRALDLTVVRQALPSLRLPRHVKALWSDYFARSGSHTVSPEGA
mgnify:CR=1 FL=1